MHRLGVRLGKELGLRNDGLRLAEIIGLLHDFGRFEQYARFRTFVGRTSVNHAELGVRILTAAGILGAIRPDVRNVILKSIACHNRPSLPNEETEAVLFHTKLLRDADKLDIWKAVRERRYLERLRGVLPDSREIDEIFGFVGKP